MDTMTSAFPDFVESFFEENDEIYQSLKPYLELKDWDSSTPPAKVEVLIDDMVCARITANEPLRPIRDITEEHETYEVQFDEEPVLFILKGFPVIDRLGEF